MRKLLEGVSGMRVLAFGAHPDDIELGAGGLVSRLSQQGAEVTMAVVSVPSLRDERMTEAAEGARILGARLSIVFREEPRRVEDAPMHELVGRFDREVADVKPDLIITHAARDLHWDHRLVHHATISSVRRHPCHLLTFMSSPEMNAQCHSHGTCFADISETIERKIAAINAHRTQVDKGGVEAESSRDLARAMGRICGLPYAEAYEVLRMRL